MFNDPKSCAEIRQTVASGKKSIRAVAHERGISRNTVKKIVASDGPRSYAMSERLRPKYMEAFLYLQRTNGLQPDGSQATATQVHRYLVCEQKAKCSYTTVCRAVRTFHSRVNVWELAVDRISSMTRKQAAAFLREITAPSKLLSWKQREFPSDGAKCEHGDQGHREAIDWMIRLQNGNATYEHFGAGMKQVEFEKILSRIREGGRRNRNKGISVLAKIRGLSARVVCQYLDISRNSFRSFTRRFEQYGADALFQNQRSRRRKASDEALKAAVFNLLHEPPSIHGFNRTTWKMDDLTSALKKSGRSACPAVVREITKAAGYRWRKAKIVLTSDDPDFSSKLARVQDTLRNLRPDEAFFSIDEFGPFSIKSKAGRVLAPPGVSPAVDQWQKSRGCLILTAALELSANQVTHFYSAKKNSDEMVKMMRVLIEEYRCKSRIFMSWDAASWHVSKKLTESINAHNRDAVLRRYPTVELVPLPASAQFLNVIESVFSGMARAIIHNSNYGSSGEAIQAIDRYFSDRNSHFRSNPKKAGRKIWGKERVPASFSTANNCKDPAFR